MSSELAPTRRTIVRVFVVTTSLGFGLLVFTFAFGTWGAGDGTMPASHYVIGVAMQVLLSLAGLPLGMRPVDRLLLRAHAPGGVGGARHELLLAPSKAAVLVGVYWITAGAVFVASAFALGHTAAESFQFIPLLLLLAVVASTITYLSLERELRPTLAELIAAGGAAPALSIYGRLLVLWVLVAGVPLLAAAASITAGLRPAATLVLIAVSLGAGPALARLSGEGLASRLVALRAAVDTIERGDFSTRVPVDDTGELGVVQAGFNRMVEGLRERDRAIELFGHHVGHEVAHQAMASGSVHAEGRVASMLFIDVIDSTPVTVRLGPDTVVALLNELFAVVVEVVGEHGGIVSRFMGDGALCLFGAPEDCDDHADRALAAGRALVASVRSSTDFDIGVGISAGPVVAGNVGAARRYEYTVIGRAVNEAARLVEQAKQRPTRALASGAAVALARQEATWWREASWFDLRGFDTPTLAFEPIVTPSRQLHGLRPMSG